MSFAGSISSVLTETITGSTGVDVNPPRIIGWGGIFADGYDGGSPNVGSIQAALDIMIPRGYNGFRCMIFNSDFPHTPTTASVINAINIAKNNNVWIILDYHGYTDPFTNQSAFLSFWNNIITQCDGLYSNIIYEPINEPIASPSALNSTYQAWINQARNLGSRKWFIISPGIQTYPSSSNPFPVITDPLNKVIYSWHEYYFYQYHNTWTNADADDFADTVAISGYLVGAQGQYVLLTEFGADPGTGAPDIVVGGSAGYAPESLEYTKRLIADLDSRGAGYLLWNAGSWDNTPGAGQTGALNIWGQFLTGSTSGQKQSRTDLAIKKLAATKNYNTDLLIKAGTSLTTTYKTDLNLKRLGNLRSSLIDASIITSGGGGPITPQFIVMIAMENQSYDTILGSGAGTNTCPFLRSLLPSGSTIPNFEGGYPGSSEGSYIAICSGDTYGAGNGTRNIGDCSTLTLINGFEATGRTYTLYQEDNNGRGGDHFWPLDFTSITNYGDTGTLGRSTCGNNRFQNIVRGATPSQVVANLNSATPSNFIWYSPTDGHNMHDNSPADGDAYLAGRSPYNYPFVRNILNTPPFTQGKGLLILWWDEPGGGNGFTPTIYVGNPSSVGPQLVKRGFISNSSGIGHYQLLRAIDNMWGMAPMSNGPSFGPGDIGAVPISDVWTFPV